MINERDIKNIIEFVKENEGKFNLDILEVKKAVEEIGNLTTENAVEVMNILEIVKCGDCDMIEFIENSTYINENDYYICESCLENNYCFCEFCEEYHYSENFLETTNGGYICENCAQHYNICAGCEKVITSDYYILCESDSNYYCDDCAEHCEISCCDDCGDYYFAEDLNCTDDGAYCNNCYEERGPVENYSYKPDPEFHKSAKDLKNETKFLGTEIEADGSRDRSCLREVADILDNLVYFKEDGSLNEGVEMVSHPCTIKYYMENKEKFAKAFQVLINSGYRSHDTNTCGYHIHISRNCLGEDRERQDAVIDRIIFLTEVFKNELKRFSRRNDFHYCRFASECSSGYKYDNMEDLEKCKRFKDNCYDRYLVLNNNNTHTIELRVFRGTLNINTFIATLQFVDNLINICRKRTLAKIDGLKWLDIINYNRNYAELKEYNKIRNIKSNKKAIVFKKEAK